MKKFITCVLLSMFSVGVAAGCEASAEVDDDDMDGDASYKKTTTVKQDDGDYKKTTETKKTD